VTAELLARIICQAIAYGELMLTTDEHDTYCEWKPHHPGAAIAVGNGRIIPFAVIPVRVLQLT